jgi:hypothetical protein
MGRISRVDHAHVEPRISAILSKQADKWGAPLLNHLFYARRPSIFKGVRAMWGALDESGLLAPSLHSLVNRRVAAQVGCVF